jgi:hypothetical protein
VAVAHDAVSQSSTTFTATSPSWTHTPTGTPRGVCVMVVQNQDTGADNVTGVTYGGVAMTRVRMATGTTGESSRIYVYFLGSGIPTGAQTVTATMNDANNKVAYCATVTAAANTQVDTSNDDAPGTANANPSLTLTFSGTLATWAAYEAVFTGLAAPVTTVQAGSTHAFGNDFGNASAMFARKAGTGGTSTTMGYTAAADDELQAGLVITEVAGGTSATATPTVVTAVGTVGTAVPAAASTAAPSVAAAAASVPAPTVQAGSKTLPGVVTAVAAASARRSCRPARRPSRRCWPHPPRSAHRSWPPAQRRHRRLCPARPSSARPPPRPGPSPPRLLSPPPRPSAARSSGPPPSHGPVRAAPTPPPSPPVTPAAGPATAFDAVTLGTGATATYDNTHTRDTLAAKLATGGTAADCTPSNTPRCWAPARRCGTGRTSTSRRTRPAHTG